LDGTKNETGREKVNGFQLADRGGFLCTRGVWDDEEFDEGLKMKERKKLPSEMYTETVKKKVLGAAHKHFHKRTGIKAVFEHGHWWVLVEGKTRTRTFDVVDAEGGRSIGGFDFEEV
jgi:hypothetical protein